MPTRRILLPALLLGLVTLPGAIAPAQTAPAAAKRTPLSYAQLLAETVLFEHPDIASVSLYTQAGDTAPLLPAAHTGSADAPPAAAALGKLAAGTPVEDGQRVLLPLVDIKGKRIGVFSVTYTGAPGEESESHVDESVAIRNYLRMIIPKRETLDDPYMKGYDSTDTLAQRINQTLLARHPDANVIAIHITAPGDTKNKVWGINRPNFIGRDSDEIDTDTEKTGRIVMQVIPATHRMEVHMPLLSPEGKLIGTLCTVYLWKTIGEAADFYGRSLGIMEEARGLTPSNRADLFKP